MKFSPGPSSKIYAVYVVGRFFTGPQDDLDKLSQTTKKTETSDTNNSVGGVEYDGDVDGDEGVEGDDGGRAFVLEATKEWEH